MPKNKKDKSVNKKAKLPHDGVFKGLMKNPLAAQDFLNYYLPKEFKALVDLSTVEATDESFVEKNLKKKVSDIIYKIKTYDGGGYAYCYVLLEHQSSPDHYMSLRLWRYMLLLCERHRTKEKDERNKKNKNKKKLPLIYPLVFYNGKRIYNAPTNLWDLFVCSKTSKALMTEDIKIVDLYSMPDEDIRKKKYLGVMEFFMKHIYARDMFKLWQQFFKNFRDSLDNHDRTVLYLEHFLYYTDEKTSDDQKENIENLVIGELSEEGEEVMRTIAQAYRDEGREEGIEQTAINMLLEGANVSFVSRVTKISLDKILYLQKNVVAKIKP